MPGSIEKRGENSYRLVVSAGVGPGKTRIKKTKTIKVEGKTDAAKKREVETELAKFIAEVENNTFIENSKVTLESFSKKWLNDYAKNKLAPKTIYEYEKLLKNRIIPSLGHLQLTKLKPIHFVEFYNNLQEDGMRLDGKAGNLSSNTISHYHKLLHKMLQTAVQWQLINNNPVSSAEPPKVTKKKADYYNEDEVKALATALINEDIKYQTIIYTALAGGFRLGEIMGLKWDDIDFKNKQIVIDESSQYIPRQGINVKDPKTESSKRIVAMPNTVMNILSMYKSVQNRKRLKCGDLWINGNFVFTQWNGLPMHPLTPSKWFSKFLKRHELKKITFHQLRHTNATILINQGINVKALSARLGHSITSTTLNIYTHELKSVDRDAADKLEINLFGNENLDNKKQQPT